LVTISRSWQLGSNDERTRASIALLLNPSTGEECRVLAGYCEGSCNITFTADEAELAVSAGRLARTVVNVTGKAACDIDEELRVGVVPSLNGNAVAFVSQKAPSRLRSFSNGEILRAVEGPS